MCADRFMVSVHPQILDHQHKYKIYHLRKKVKVPASTANLDMKSVISEDDNVSHDQIGSSTLQENDGTFDHVTDYSNNDACATGDDTQADPQTDTRNGVITDYENACRLYNILPLSCIAQGLLRETLTCKSVRLRDYDCRAICQALLNNRFVERLDFQENYMGPEPSLHFADVIQVSTFLTHIKLADNGIKSEGAKVICKSASMNPKIVSLDLSGNGLVESDGVYIQSLLENSNNLRELFLARNHLMDIGVRHIAVGLKSTTSLKVLDLSWNHIRLKGATAICGALGRESSIENLNLAWNGLNKFGAKRLSLALKKNSTLTELDISCNRLSEAYILDILQGLQNNSTLKILRIGLNHVSPAAARHVLKAIHTNKTSGIKLLDMGTQEVYDDFEYLYKDLQKERQITVIYGSVWNSDRTSFAERPAYDKELVLLSCNPLTVLMECMRLQSMRLLDFFKWLDVDNDNHLCINELCDGMVRVGIPLHRKTLLRLLHKLDLDNNNLLDFKEMMAAFNTHRENVRKELAEHSGCDFEQTEIGKISTTIRKLMEKKNALKKTNNEAKTRMRRGSMLATSMSYERKDVSLSNTRDRRNSRTFLPQFATVSLKRANTSIDGHSLKAITEYQQHVDGLSSKTSKMLEETTASPNTEIDESRVFGSLPAKESDALPSLLWKKVDTSTMATPSLAVEYPVIHGEHDPKMKTVKFPDVHTVTNHSKAATLVSKQLWDSTF